MQLYHIGCLSLSVKAVRGKKDKEVLSEDEKYEDFHPTFTYPVRLEAELALGRLTEWR